MKTKTEKKRIEEINKILDNISYDDLPGEWQFEESEIKKFSNEKTLFDYQIKSLENLLKFLSIYYKNYNDDANKLKEQLKEYYLENSIKEEYFEELEINKERKPELFEIAKWYYPISQDDKISYVNFLNRCSFWMATGSGKTLVIVKLIYILKKLMDRQTIPKGGILFLTYRDDLLKSFEKYVNEFNENSEIKITLKSLKEAGNQQILLEEKSIVIYYYKSTNIVNETGKVLLDFKRYENNGEWYIILDEAHKGEKEKSKSQLIYSIMSRNRFLFNFSATFTDPSDIATTVYNISFPEYIKRGYGKIIIPIDTIEGFKKTDKEFENKEHIREFNILKNLVLLSALKEALKLVRSENSSLQYHNPLMVLYTNTVSLAGNKENEQKIRSDLYNVFVPLANIANPGNSEVKKLFELAKEEVEKLLKENEIRKQIIPELNKNASVVEDFDYDKFIEYISKLVDKLDSFEKILESVYNSKSPGTIEFSILESKNKEGEGEIALSLKTGISGSGKPFALIKIGNENAKTWKKFLMEAGYEVSKTPLDTSSFAKLNQEESPINILLGSRVFFEGWDSNRPNIITFVNIGGKEAQKYVLQAIGRGLRIEPFAGERKRIAFNLDKIKAGINVETLEYAKLLEKLFISSTNLEAVEFILENLHKLAASEGIPIGEHFEINEEIRKENAELLVPKYKLKKVDEKYLKKVILEQISQTDLTNLNKFISWLNDQENEIKQNTLKLLAINNAESDFAKLNFIYNNLLTNKEKQTQELEEITKPKIVNPIETLRKISTLIDDIKNDSEELDAFQQITDESIKHFRNIKVYIGKYSDTEITETNVTNLAEVIELIKKNKNISWNELNLINEKINIFRIKLYDNLIRHYYIPVLVPKDKDFIKFTSDIISNIIREESELNFINSLNDFVSNSDRYKNEFEKYFDFWYFSRLEPTDNIYIRYFNSNSGALAKFIPDFIFWFKRHNKYVILFADPKSSAFNFEDKVNGFKELFMEGDRHRIFKYKSTKNDEYFVIVDLKLLNNKPPENPFWIENNAEKLFEISKKLLDSI